MLLSCPSSPFAGLHSLSCQCHLSGRRKWITFSYITYVSAHAGVTLKRSKNNNNQTYDKQLSQQWTFLQRLRFQGFFYRASLLDSRNLKKKKTENRWNLHWRTNTCDNDKYLNYITVFEHNYSWRKQWHDTYSEFYSLLMHLSIACLFFPVSHRLECANKFKHLMGVPLPLRPFPLQSAI